MSMIRGRRHVSAPRRVAAVAAVVAALGVWAGGARAATVTVVVNPNAPSEFTPASVTVQTGDTVMWTHPAGQQPTSVDFGNASACFADGTFRAPVNSGAGFWTASRTFATPGTYSYFDVNSCGLGSNAVGTITVVAASTSSTSTTSTTSSASLPASAPSGSVTASVAVTGQFKSVNVSASSETFDNCSGGSSSGSTLGFPNGQCTTPSYTVTNNGTVAEGIDVAGANATASNGGTGWSLVSTGLGAPGLDQFGLNDSSGAMVTTTAVCDSHVSGCSLTSQNSLAPAGAFSDSLRITGPSAESNAGASSFTTAVTYTAI